MRFLPALPAAALAALLLAAGCSQEPSDVGIGALIPSDTLQRFTREFQATADTTFLARINGAAGRLLQGTSGDLEARTMMEFSGVAGFSSGTVIDSAFVRMAVEYRFGDSTGEFDFTTYPMTKPWTSDQKVFNWDSAAVSYNSLTPAGSFLTTLNPSDTTIRFGIDTSVIRGWWQNSAGIGSIILVPGVSTTAILGFSNTVTLLADSRPQLEIYFHDTTFVDTLVLRAARAMFVGNASPAVPAGEMVLQSGVVYRDRLRFDSLSLPPKASITVATLRVTVDPANSIRNGSTRDSLTVLLLRGATFPYDTVALGTLLKPAGANVYQGDVKDIVQQWVEKQANVGFVLRSLTEQTTIDRWAIYGAGSAAFRPKLTVTYTVFP